MHITTTGLIAVAALLATQASAAPAGKSIRPRRSVGIKADAIASAHENVNQAFSQALLNPSVGLAADDNFSSLLMSVIQSSEARGGGNIPVIQL
ncbi:hypothetical protein GGI23_000332 [Coemansia sp. RSA 2559]|nr:hypothetical protein GGI23_000332 [Coemansia sp. RSA 2559]